MARVTRRASTEEIQASWYRSGVRQGVLDSRSLQPTKEFKAWCATCEGRVAVLSKPVTKTENPARLKPQEVYFEKKTDEVAYFLTFDEQIPGLRVSGEVVGFYCPYVPPYLP